MPTAPSLLRAALAAATLVASEPAGLSGQVRSFPPQLAVQVLQTPAPVAAGDTTYLCYELHVTSYTGDTAWIKRVEVFAGSSRDRPALVTYEGDQVAGNLFRPGMAPAAADRVGGADRSIPPASHAIVYLWVPLTTSGAAPDRVINRLTFELAGPSGQNEEVAQVETSVQPASSVPTLGPPLKGGPWAAFNGPGNTSGHRRTPLVVDGRAAISQRYAIDYMLLAPNGRPFEGDSTRNEAYPSYGREAIAVADAVVVRVYDGVKDNIARVTTRPDTLTLATAVGNGVVLDLGGGRFGFYAHFQPGTLRVKTGQRVRRGDVLGLVGNAGNTGAPHLHFHVIDGAAPLGSEGLPYLIDRFDLVGTCDPYILVVPSRIPGPCTLGVARPRTRSIPLREQVVRFPD